MRRRDFLRTLGIGLASFLSSDLIKLVSTNELKAQERHDLLEKYKYALADAEIANPELIGVIEMNGRTIPIFVPEEDSSDNQVLQEELIPNICQILELIVTNVYGNNCIPDAIALVKDFGMGVIKYYKHESDEATNLLIFDQNYRDYQLLALLLHELDHIIQNRHKYRESRGHKATKIKESLAHLISGYFLKGYIEQRLNVVGLNALNEDTINRLLANALLSVPEAKFFVNNSIQRDERVLNGVNAYALGRIVLLPLMGNAGWTVQNMLDFQNHVLSNNSLFEYGPHAPDSDMISIANSYAQEAELQGLGYDNLSQYINNIVYNDLMQNDTVDYMEPLEGILGIGAYGNGFTFTHTMVIPPGSTLHLKSLGPVPQRLYLNGISESLTANRVLTINQQTASVLTIETQVADAFEISYTSHQP